MNIEEQKQFIQPPQSFWLASTPETQYPTLNEDIKVDIIEGPAVRPLEFKKDVNTIEKLIKDHY
jgi:hypothetical protein